MTHAILVVDDETVLRNNLVRYLGRNGRPVQGAASAEEALERMATTDFSVVVTDLRMPGMGGAELIERLRVERPETLVLVMTAYASVESAIAALRAGAHDYLIKPLSLEDVDHKVERLLRVRELEFDNRRLRDALHSDLGSDSFIAESPPMREVMRLVDRAAASRSTVLIEGESGTGKELVARALHDQAPWCDEPFIAVNLAAQPRDLVDATLFGHERGAYTGAVGARQGVFRAARGGTVFLDEISELPLEIQVKLLRVLQNREVLPLGSDRPVQVDFRLVAATNKSLIEGVQAGSFRNDLLYRVEVVKITLPPLRDRPGDLIPLIGMLLRQHATSMARSVPTVTSEAMRSLERHSWPGNVRELSNAIERAVLLCNDDLITVNDLPLQSYAAEGDDLKSVLDRAERRHITAVLTACDGDKGRAAERLGVHLATLYRRLEKLEIR